MDILKSRQGAHRWTAHLPLRIVRVCAGPLSYICIKMQVPVRGLFASWISSCYDRQFAERKLQRFILQVVISFPALLFAATGQCNSATDFVKKILGSNMDSVAVKVADLPQKYHEVYSRGLDFSPDGEYIAVESEHGDVKIWDWRKSRVVATLKNPRGSNEYSNPIHYSPDGKLLADCIGRGVGDVFVRIWNTTDWSIEKDIIEHGNGGCSAIGFAQDGKLFVRTVDYRLGSPDNTIIVHDVGTWRIMWGLQPKNFAPQFLAVSPGGNLVAVAGTVLDFPSDIDDPLERAIKSKFEPKILIIDLRQKKIVDFIPSKVVGPIAWSSDGNLLTVASGGLEIINVKTSESVLFGPEKGAAHMNIRYTSDGKYFIESDMNGRGTGLGVKIWDASRQHLLQKIHGNIGSIAVSRDGEYLAVGATGHTTIWQFK